jgi:hypothetical protein
MGSAAVSDSIISYPIPVVHVGELVYIVSLKLCEKNGIKDSESCNVVFTLNRM